MQTILEAYYIILLLALTSRRLNIHKARESGFEMDRELEMRAFWAINIIDKYCQCPNTLIWCSEYRGLFVDKGSGREKYEDEVGYPFKFEDPAGPFEESNSTRTDRQAAYFFLALISMRRTCNRTKYTRKHGFCCSHADVDV